ncbi:carbon-nitrogen hydrolase [Irpex lacteus]|nr:carbon-nitrogen hydrolase [Irpex lacteus]
MWLANNGNYRELRYFTPWQKHRQVEDHYLPRIVHSATGQTKLPFGDAVVSTVDTCFGVEMCEELFTQASPHILMGLDGVEIFTNSSGSHHELRKLYRRIELIKEATLKLGCIYLYANQQGCDGDRLYYDGCALIVVNGKVVAQGSQFSLNDVEVVTATVDLEDVRAHRAVSSRSMQAAAAERYERIKVDFALSGGNFDSIKDLDDLVLHDWEPKYHRPEEEIAFGHGVLAVGLPTPIPGGMDSCATATIVFSICRLVSEASQRGDQRVIADARRIAGEPEDTQWVPTDPRDLANKIFHTCYMGTENSSVETRKRAKELAEAIGSYHTDLNMDSLVTAVRNLFAYVTGGKPVFGRLRKVDKAGPYSMFMKLVHQWGSFLSPLQVAEKVNHFFFEYARNRLHPKGERHKNAFAHEVWDSIGLCSPYGGKFLQRIHTQNRRKLTTLTPGYHAEQYSPDDNRFDLRPFLYPSRFPW